MNASTVYAMPCASPLSSTYTGDTRSSSSSTRCRAHSSTSLRRSITLTVVTGIIVLSCLIVTVTVTRDTVYEKVKNKLLVPHSLTVNNLTDAAPTSLELSASRPIVTYDDDNGILDTPLVNDRVNGNNKKHVHSTLVVRDYVKVTTNDALVSEKKVTNTFDTAHPLRDDSSHYNRLQPIMSINGYYYGLYPVIQRSLQGTNELSRQQITAPLTLSSSSSNTHALHSPLRQSLQWSKMKHTFTPNDSPSPSSSSSIPPPLRHPLSPSHPSPSFVNKGHSKLPFHRESDFHSTHSDNTSLQLSSTAAVHPFNGDALTYDASRPLYPALHVDRKTNYLPANGKFTFNSSNNHAAIDDASTAAAAAAVSPSHYSPGTLSYTLAMPYFCRCVPRVPSESLSSPPSKSQSLPLQVISGYIPVLRPPPLVNSGAVRSDEKWINDAPVNPLRVDDILEEKKESIHVSLRSMDDTNKSNSLNSSSTKLISLSNVFPETSEITGDANKHDKMMKEITKNTHDIVNEITVVDGNEKRMNKEKKIDEQVESIRSTSSKDDSQKVSLV